MSRQNRPGGHVNVVAVVLARGGSKGVPLKNLVSIGGRPLIEHTLERAQSADAVDATYVSTDHPDIAEVSAALGAEIVWRPAELCTDRASSESGLLHCLDHIESALGAEPSLIVFLQPTSPLRSKSHIDDAVALLRQEDADSLFSAGPLMGLAWKVEGEGVIPVSYDPKSRLPRQEAPEYLAENGSIYVFKPWVLRREGCRLGGRVVPFRMQAQDSFEVDEVDDVPVVDFLLRRRYPDLVCGGGD
jgi:N-acylneuraminate cytidylyltransferase